MFTFFQEELDDVVREWNCHRIRNSERVNVVSGRPMSLYMMPELYGRTDHLVGVNPRQLQPCLDECIFRDYPCDQDVFQLCLRYMADNGIREPRDHRQALNLYLRLRRWINRAIR